MRALYSLFYRCSLQAREGKERDAAARNVSRICAIAGGRRPGKRRPTQPPETDERGYVARQTLCVCGGGRAAPDRLSPGRVLRPGAALAGCIRVRYSSYRLQ
jgi:hypothetical protein